MLYSIVLIFALCIVIWSYDMDLINLKNMSAAALANYNNMKQALADADAKVNNLTEQLAAAQTNAAALAEQRAAAVTAVEADLRAMMP